MWQHDVLGTRDTYELNFINADAEVNCNQEENSALPYVSAYRMVTQGR